MPVLKPLPKRTGIKAPHGLPKASPQDQSPKQNHVMVTVSRALEDTEMCYLAAAVYSCDRPDIQTMARDLIRTTMCKSEEELERLRILNRDAKNKRYATMRMHHSAPDELANLNKNIATFKAKYRFYTYVLKFIRDEQRSPSRGV